jgi:NADH-quinone oxidoreductase subunit N
VAATAFYLAVYLMMNLAAFSVIAVRERETEFGDDIASMNGLGASNPVLAWVMTIAMLALAGIPATAGFFGKVYLIDAAVNNGYGWLSVFIVLGSAVSLAYYLRVIAAVWLRSETDARRITPGGRPVMAGGAPENDDVSAMVVREDSAEASAGELGSVVPGAGPHEGHPFAVFSGVLCAAATVFFGIYPQPLFDVAQDAGRAIASLL